MFRSLLVALLLFALVATTLYAGNDPSADPIATGCHGAKTEAKGASSCHGRRQTILQRAAARQESRQEARAEKRAVRALCHGEKKAEACECSDCDNCCK